MLMQFNTPWKVSTKKHREVNDCVRVPISPCPCPMSGPFHDDAFAFAHCHLHTLFRRDELQKTISISVPVVRRGGAKQCLLLFDNGREKKKRELTRHRRLVVHKRRCSPFLFLSRKVSRLILIPIPTLKKPSHIIHTKKQKLSLFYFNSQHPSHYEVLLRCDSGRRRPRPGYSRCSCGPGGGCQQP